jgi:hypothetical protein
MQVMQAFGGNCCLEHMRSQNIGRTLMPKDYVDTIACVLLELLWTLTVL